MRDILTIAKKELKACFRDKVVLLQILIVPFIFVYGYSLLMSAVTEGEKPVVENTKTAYSINASAEFSSALAELNIIPAPDNDIEKYKDQIKNKEIDLLVVFPEDFKVAEPGAENLSDIEVYYNSSNGGSTEIYTAVNALFTAMQPRVFTVNNSEEGIYDLFDSAVVFRRFLGSILPMMVFAGVFIVCMSLAANSVAGDKESGFLNTLLVTPVKRFHLATGKSVTILIVSILSSISACIGMVLSLPSLAKAMDFVEAVRYGVMDYCTIFLGVISGVFVLVALLLIVSALSKSVKQATTIAPVFMILIMVPSLLGSMESFSNTIDSFGTKNYLIPVWNSELMLKKVMELDYSASNVLITCVVNLAVAAVCIGIVGKLFDNEKIVNG